MNYIYKKMLLSPTFMKQVSSFLFFLVVRLFIKFPRDDLILIETLPLR